MRPARYTLPGILYVEVSLRRPHADDDGIRLCVTGGRTVRDLGYVWSMLDTLHNMPAEIGGRGPIVELGAGCAKGVDALALAWAVHNEVPWSCYHADWDGLGEAAGAVRNGAMLEDFEPEILVVYDGGTGTTDCARKARKLRIERLFHPLITDPFEEAQRWG